MNRTPRLSISGIEYLDYQWGIWSGCENHLRGICGGGGRDFHCWAQSLAFRFPALYPDGFNPHYYPEAIDSPKYLRKPSIIGVGWVGDVIGYGLDYKEQIYSTIRACPHHIFMFLTKNPEALPLWGPFPDNCRVGFTATNTAEFQSRSAHIAEIKAKLIYVSLEPLLSWEMGATCMAGYLEERNIGQVIIGAQTHPYKPPKIEWVQEIVGACDKAGVLVFLKDKLKPLFSSGEPTYWAIRQEMPGELCRTG